MILPLRFKTFDNSLEHCFRTRFAFPNDNDLPAQRPPVAFVLFVAFDVLSELFRPVPGMGFGAFVSRTRWGNVLMPKAAANVDYRPVLRQDDIRLTRQAFHVQTISKPLLVQVRPHDFFRSRVLAFHLLHGESPLLRRKGIHGNYLIQ